MATLEETTQIQLANIEEQTGKSLKELKAVVAESGMQKHRDIREMLMKKFGLGNGDANALTHYALQSDGEGAAKAKGPKTVDILADIYRGTQASIRPLHDALIGELSKFGDFEIAPKIGYVSLRRSKQFAMVGPAARNTLEVGINTTEELSTRFIKMPPNSMCQYKLRIAAAKEIDAHLVSTLKSAFEQAK